MAMNAKGSLYFQNRTVEYVLKPNTDTAIIWVVFSPTIQHRMPVAAVSPNKRGAFLLKSVSDILSHSICESFSILFRISGRVMSPMISPVSFRTGRSMRL